MKYPFSQARWEQDARHFFHLPVDEFSRLQESKPSYLIGSRGTGKTTLLKALNWAERLANPSLQSQLKVVTGSENLFDGHYVGVYFKLPRTQLALIDAFVPAGDPRYPSLVGLYLAFNWVDILAEATAGLLEGEVIAYSPEDEEGAALALHNAYEDAPLVQRYLDPREVRSLRLLARAMRRLRRHFETDIQSGVGPEELVRNFPVGAPGEFADIAGKAMARLYPANHEEPWFFLVCMDEGEHLTERQQIALNSIVRVAERPLMPVVAYLSPPRPLTDTAGRMTTTNADVDLISMDRMGDKRFAKFVEGVASVRIQEAAQQPEAHLELNALLGRLAINELLLRLLKSSTDSWGQQLLAKAEANAEVPFFKERNATAPPIYQTYLVETLELELPEPQAKNWETRKQKSAEIRKKIAAAYLSICQKVGVQPLYASADMMLQMSDQCVRDFLWQMHEIFVETGDSPSEFLARTNIPVETQDKALRRASDQKISRVADSVMAEASTVTRLVDGLGLLTGLLQRPLEGRLRSGFTQHLRSNEPGAFRLPSAESFERDEDSEKTLELIRLAIDGSYLRQVSGSRETMRFRLHTSLAAHYGFSYRGAYSDTLLSLDELRRICAVSGEKERRELIAGIAARLTGDPDPQNTLPMFDEE